MTLFLKPPTIDPKDYLSPEEATKVAATRLTSPPSYWDDEIRQTLLREHPYVPADRVVVNFSQRDDATGTAMGYIGIAGSPGVSIPVIIKNRELSPLDVLVVANKGKGGPDDQQGAGDMTDDKVVPLNEDTFTQAMDAGPVGDAVTQHSTTGTAYTEDASALRLPFRGRTVVASLAAAVGCTEAQKEALATVLKKHANAPQIAAGFVINKSAEVIDSWFSADAPKRTWQNKIASTEVAKENAIILTGMPDTFKTAEVLAALVIVEDETYKTACRFEAIDLANPDRGLSSYLMFEDGSYCAAPEELSGTKLAGEAEEAAAVAMLAAREVPPLRIGNTLMFHSMGVFTAPAKLASMRNNMDQKNIALKLIDDHGSTFDVLLDKRIKEATYEADSKTWVFPLSAKVLVMGDYAALSPMPTEKVAQTLTRQLTDSLVCNSGQYTLTIRGETFGEPAQTETKMAGMLNKFFGNADEMMRLVKEAAAADIGGTGLLRFGSDTADMVQDYVKRANDAVACDDICRGYANDIRMPLDKAVKLASAIGDPEGVDAILGAGFLTEDNLSEFVNLSGQFEETVSKLARLLLAVRMGFPGDETATVVAMKSLSRVAERLQSAGQEV